MKLRCLKAYHRFPTVLRIESKSFLWFTRSYVIYRLFTSIYLFIFPPYQFPPTMLTISPSSWNTSCSFLSTCEPLPAPGFTPTPPDHRPHVTLALFVLLMYTGFSHKHSSSSLKYFLFIIAHVHMLFT